MDGINDAVKAIIKTGQYDDYLAILKGFRNGMVYGAKIRFPHAVSTESLTAQLACDDVVVQALRFQNNGESNSKTYLSALQKVISGH